MNWKQRLGEEIERARRKKGWTQDQLRLEVGFSVNAIGQYERGERAPDFERLQKIAAALAADRFQVDDNMRIEFSANGNARAEPPAQQLDLDFDENRGVTVRIEPTKEGLAIKKILA